MRERTSEAGFTLVELLVASAVAALVVVLLSAATFQFVTATADGHDRLAVLRDHGNAFQWLNRDAQMAVSDQATVLPASVTLNWTDAITGTTYQSSYSQSGDELVRTLTVNGTPSSQTVARNLDTSGFSASLTDDLLTVTIASVQGDTAQTRTESVLMRAAGAAPANPMRLATGSYVGNQANGRQITSVGFQPDVVFIKAEADHKGVVRTSTMTGDATKVLISTGSLEQNRIESLDADGFTVGSDDEVNKAGVTYYWAAMKAGDDLVVGSYVGNDSDNRSITGVGFQPVWVLTLGDNNDNIFRPSSLSGDNSYNFSDTNKKSNRIQALEADGFQVGDSADVNESSRTYHYVAWATSSQVSVGSYTGDNPDNRSITGIGFQPEMVWIKRDNSQNPVWRPASVSGDGTLYFNDTQMQSNRIQALESDGFQVGTHNEVNRINRTYHYLALRDGGP